MVGISDWADLMNDAVQVERFLRRDSYGKATFGPAVNYKARVNYATHLVRVSASEEAVSRGTAWLATATVVGVQDRITLPDGSNPLILVSIGETDETGAVLYCRLDFA